MMLLVLVVVNHILYRIGSRIVKKRLDEHMDDRMPPLVENVPGRRGRKRGTGSLTSQSVIEACAVDDARERERVMEFIKQQEGEAMPGVSRARNNSC